MADKIRTVTQAIANSLYQQKFNSLKSPLPSFSNATEQAQKHFEFVKSSVAAKYDALTKQLNNGTMIIENSDRKDIEMTPVTIPPWITKWWNQYHQLTGLDKVELYRQQVNIAQEKLFNCQANRRNLSQEVILLNNKLREVYGELLQTKREDVKYVQLTIMENKTLQELSKLATQLELLEKEEREHFICLATAIKEHHQSQAINSQKFKYLCIIASSLLAVLSLTGSMISNQKRIRDLNSAIRNMAEENQNAFNAGFLTIQKSLNQASVEKERIQPDSPITLTGVALYAGIIVLGICILGYR